MKTVALAAIVLGAALLPLSRTAADTTANADSLMEDGMALFFAGRPKESVEAFDRVILAAPTAAPALWQRGLALYYAEDFQGGRKQFELHQTANPNDVENAAWHFICIARMDGADAARKALMPISGDTRVPMKEIHELFAGKGSEQSVLAAASKGERDSEARRNQLCYAHLYLGLYFESVGEIEKAKNHMLKSATSYRMEHYMGKVAQVHVKLRKWAD